MKFNRICIVVFSCIAALNASSKPSAHITSDYDGDIFIRIDRTNGTGETRKLFKGKTVTVPDVGTISKLGLGEKFIDDWRTFFDQQSYQQNEDADLDFTIDAEWIPGYGYGRWMVERGGETITLGRKRDLLGGWLGWDAQEASPQEGLDEGGIRQAVQFLLDKSFEEGKQELLRDKELQREFLKEKRMNDDDIERVLELFEQEQKERMEQLAGGGFLDDWVSN